MAQELQISRQEQDEYTIASYEKALNAQEKGIFAKEIIPINCQFQDEEPKKFKREKIATLKPAFQSNGTMTPASSSKLNDGAAVLVLASGRFCQQNSILPIAKIVDFAEETQVSEISKNKL